MWQQHYSNNWLIKSGPSEKVMVGRLVYCFRHQHGCITKKQWNEPANSFRHGWFQESPATMTINNTQKRADLNTNVAKTEWTREIHTNQSSSTECSRGIERGDLSQREGGWERWEKEYRVVWFTYWSGRSHHGRIRTISVGKGEKNYITYLGK